MPRGILTPDSVPEVQFKVTPVPTLYPSSVYVQGLKNQPFLHIIGGMMQRTDLAARFFAAIPFDDRTPDKMIECFRQADGMLQAQNLKFDAPAPRNGEPVEDGPKAGQEPPAEKSPIVLP